MIANVCRLLAQGTSFGESFSEWPQPSSGRGLIGSRRSAARRLGPGSAAAATGATAVATSTPRPTRPSSGC
eukprot:1852282-Pyramimonas_sp.AAC.1